MGGCGVGGKALSPEQNGLAERTADPSHGGFVSSGEKLSGRLRGGYGRR